MTEEEWRGAMDSVELRDFLESLESIETKLGLRKPQPVVVSETGKEG